jgi:riboflavin transporter FmnP
VSPGLSKARWLTHTALYLAIAIILPIGFHMFGIAGRVFLPMHLPVLLAGFLVGPISGLLVGLMGPSLSHLLTGMPPSYAVPLMMGELAIYGLIAGITFLKLRWNIYGSLITALVLGRVVFGGGLYLLGRFMNLPYDVAFFFSTAGPIVEGLPGIVIQLVLVPILVTAVQRRRRLR